MGESFPLSPGVAPLWTLPRGKGTGSTYSRWQGISRPGLPGPRAGHSLEPELVLVSFPLFHFISLLNFYFTLTPFHSMFKSVLPPVTGTTVLVFSTVSKTQDRSTLSLALTTEGVNPCDWINLVKNFRYNHYGNLTACYLLKLSLILSLFSNNSDF